MKAADVDKYCAKAEAAKVNPKLTTSCLNYNFRKRRLRKKRKSAKKRLPRLHLKNDSDLQFAFIFLAQVHLHVPG